VVLVALASAASAQDLKLRQEAVTLLSGAYLKSTPSIRGAYRMEVSFRASGGPAGEDEGIYKHVVASPEEARVEVQSKDFHSITVSLPDRRAMTHSRDVTPMIERTVMRLTPIYLVRFDHADVIRSIVNTSSNGRQARCIEFDTTYGEKTSANEICIDQENGTVVHMRIEAETYDYSAFFPFRDALYPGHIEFEGNGTRIVLEQTVKEAQLPLDPSELAAPEGTEFVAYCKEFRPAVVKEMSRPRAGNGSATSEIVMRGEVQLDGKVHELTIDSSNRPDLNAEALEVVSSWTFTPATCDGKPNFGMVVITLHFQGR
jgi:hypothetical protein